MSPTGRKHAQLQKRIWRDPHWRALPVVAQWLYEALLSQDSLNYAGVIALTEQRWAKLAADLTITDIEESLEVLARQRFLVIDRDTEEVLVRSFIRNDGLWKQPRMLAMAVRQAHETLSPVLRGVLGGELRLIAGMVDREKDAATLLSEAEKLGSEGPESGGGPGGAGGGEPTPEPTPKPGDATGGSSGGGAGPREGLNGPLLEGVEGGANQGPKCDPGHTPDNEGETDKTTENPQVRGYEPPPAPTPREGVTPSSVVNTPSPSNKHQTQNPPLAPPQRPSGETPEPPLRVGPQDTPQPPAKQRTGHFLPDGWTPDPAVIDAMRTKHPNVDLRFEHEKFTDHWRAASGANGRKRDWNAAWRNWIRRAATNHRSTPAVSGMSTTEARAAHTLSLVANYETPTTPTLLTPRLELE